MSSIDVVTTSFSRKNYLGLLVIIAGNEVTEFTDYIKRYLLVIFNFNYCKSLAMKDCESMSIIGLDLW